MTSLRPLAVAFLVLLAVAAGGAGIAAADDAPGEPANYYGDAVDDGGTDAPTGTIIVAVVDGEVEGEITVDTTGQYGDEDAFGEKLSLDSAAGDQVSFHVDDPSGPEATMGPVDLESGTHEKNLTFPSGTFDGGGNDDGGNTGGDNTGGDGDPGDDGTTDDDGPDVTVRTANVSRTTVETGETVTVNATLATEGTRAANVTITLRVDDVPVRNETLSVPAEGNRTVTLTHTFDEPGEYNLAVGNESVGPVTVESDGATTTGTADGSDETTDTADGETSTSPGTATTEQTTDGSDETTDTADGETSTSPGTATTEQTTDGSGPGFGVVVAVLAVLSAALLARRRR